MGLFSGLKRGLKKVVGVHKKAIGSVVDPLNITGIHNKPRVRVAPPDPRDVIADAIRTGSWRGLYPNPQTGELNVPQMQIPERQYGGSMAPPTPLPQTPVGNGYRWNQLPRQQSYTPTGVPQLKLPGAMNG